MKIILYENTYVYSVVKYLQHYLCYVNLKLKKNIDFPGSFTKTFINPH